MLCDFCDRPATVRVSYLLMRGRVTEWMCPSCRRRQVPALKQLDTVAAITVVPASTPMVVQHPEDRLLTAILAAHPA